MTSPNPFDQPSSEEEKSAPASNPFDEHSAEEKSAPASNPFDQPSAEEGKPAASSNPFDQPSDEHLASMDSFTQPAEDHTAPVNEPSAEPANPFDQPSSEPANPFDQPSVEPAASQPADSLFDLTPAQPADPFAQPANGINPSAQMEAPQAASPNLFGASPVKTETTATPAQEDPMAFDFSSVVAETEKANKPSLWRRSENEEKR